MIVWQGPGDAAAGSDDVDQPSHVKHSLFWSGHVPTSLPRSISSYFCCLPYSTRSQKLGTEELASLTTTYCIDMPAATNPCIKHFCLSCRACFGNIYEIYIWFLVGVLTLEGQRFSSAKQHCEKHLAQLKVKRGLSL